MTIGCKEFSKDFGKRESVVWKEINTFVEKNNLRVINIETIFYKVSKVSYNLDSDVEVSNMDKKGFRVFYETK